MPESAGQVTCGAEVAGSRGGSWEAEPWGALPDLLNYGSSLGAQLPPTVSTDCVPGMVVGAGDTEVKHRDDHPCPRGAGTSLQAVGGEGRPEMLRVPTDRRRLQRPWLSGAFPKRPCCPAG